MATSTALALEGESDALLAPLPHDWKLSADAVESSWPSWLTWKPTSDGHLRTAEQGMLKLVKTDKEQFKVKIGTAPDGTPITINTLKVGQGSPLVLVHGFGGGLGIWLKNLDELSKHHTVYAIDLLGFGRSSRAPFPGKTAEEAEEYFIQSLEAWRATLGLEDFDLLGHSMGAYISTTYALKYPTNIKRLLLADPWGVPEKPPGWENRLSPVFRTIFKVVSSLSNSPLSLLRAAGPAGPALIGRVRPDLINKFGQFFPEKDSTALDYIYHVNAQSPAGEEAFGKLLGSFAFAARPLVSRIHNLPETLPVSFIYGEDTWMDKHSGIVARQAVRGPTDFVVIPDAGHHVYIDNFPLFNEAVALATKGKLSVLSNKLSGLIDEIRPDTRLSP